jgi:guanine nucleotide-binding protein subunit alpha
LFPVTYSNPSYNSFLNEIQRIAIDTDYIPTVQDVLFARSKTTGITETRFNVGNQLSIQ